MIIDVHQHITYGKFPQFAKIKDSGGHGSFSSRQLLDDMDKWGIDKSVILPIVNPENIDYFGAAGNQEVITECQRHPDRLIPFCNIDPRGMLNHKNADFSTMMRIFKDLGCKGIGEICANIQIAEPLCKNLYSHAGKENLPILFHLTARKGKCYGLIDKPGLPGLQEVLKEFPSTVFIGHAPAFWNEIDAFLGPRMRGGYPKGSIEKDGSLWRLMEKYPNLYADISAGSGLNALTRDSEVGYRFINNFQMKIFFGTDMFFRKNKAPGHLTMMQDALKGNHISKTVYENIMHKNFERVFK